MIRFSRHILIACVLALPLLAAAQDPVQVDLSPGGVRTIRFPSRITKIQVENPRVAGVRVVGARVDDLANRLVRHLADRGDHLLAHRCHARVHDEHAIRIDLQSDVCSRPGDHMNVALNGDHFDVAIIVRGLDAVNSW